MKYNILGYLIGEGFGNVFKNKKSTGASLMIMCATMIIFGIFLILTENINHFVSKVESEQGIQVFINNDATQEQIEEIKEKIMALDGVSTADFISKEQALNQMKERFGDKKDLLAGYEENNIFPPSSVFIIANTIKLTVHARRKEISIMKYVGATNGFIRWPFIVEGMIIGVVASIISIAIVGTGYSFLAEQMVNAQFMQVINMTLITFGDMFNSIIFVYMLLGIGIGAIGSVISMRKYLKV